VHFSLLCLGFFLLSLVFFREDAEVGGVVFYFSSWSITSFYRLGDSTLRVRTLASFLMFVVMCLRCSLKFIMRLMCTPSILYDLLGGRYRMGVPSSNLIVAI